MISVFTPTHNPSYLGAVYTSLKNQSYQDWEWVVLLNNGAQFDFKGDPRVKVHYDDTGFTHVGYLKKTACRLAKGDILLELDHDDQLLPGALEACAQAFQDPAVVFAYSNTVNHDVRSNSPVVWSERYGWRNRPFEHEGQRYLESISADPYPQSISRIWFAPNHFRAWRTTTYWKIGGHKATMKISDDHDLMLRTFIEGKMVHIDKPLYLYRVHGNNTWLQNMQDIQDTMWACHDRYIHPMAMRWAKDNNLRCLDLGGGINCPAGYESVDTHDCAVKADLTKRWPFEDHSVGLIRANDIIEHLPDPIHTMNEAYRVLAHGGFFLIEVPSTNGVGAWCDPTHKSFWNARSFKYYTEPNTQRYLLHAGVNCKFQSIKVKDIVQYDNIPYVVAHLVAVKQATPRFYGEMLWSFPAAS